MKPLTLILLLLFFGTAVGWSYQPDRCCETPLVAGQQISAEVLSGNERAAQVSKQKQALRQLAGSWINSYPDLKLESLCGTEPDLRIKQAVVKYYFRADGTFQKVLTSREDPDIRIEETGEWKVSADGQQLKLYRETATGDMLVTHAQIKYLELDELVLSNLVAAIGDRQVANQDKDLFFNKQ